MAHSYWITPATEDLIREVAEHARASDIEELDAAAGESPLACMLRGASMSGEVWAGMVDDAPICIFGVARPLILSAMGAPWMVGTTLLEAHARPFLRHSREVIADILGRYDYLANFVDCRNAKAITWLRWLGFKMLPPIPYGHRGLEFHPFELRRR